MKKGTVILLFIFTSFNLSMAQIEIMEKFDLGEYGVGFKNETLTDYSRAYGDDYRPIQLFIWYPADKNITTPIQYEEYFLVSNKKSQPVEIDSLIRQEIENLKKVDKTDVNLSKYRNLKTIAQREAPAAQKSFPLLLFSPGGNTSGHIHSVISEYLASHGYIVVSFPSLGNAHTQRWPFDQTGIDLHIDDMALAINHLQRTMNQIDIDKTGLISWSVGGVSQSVYCMKNSNIDLLISLDSGLGRTYGIEMLKESHYYDYKKFQIPYLHMTGAQAEIFQVDRSTAFYDSIASSEKYSLVIEPFAHQHFAAQLGIIPELASENEDEAITKSYVSMCHLSLVFINAYLKDKFGTKQEWLDIIKDY